MKAIIQQLRIRADKGSDMSDWTRSEIPQVLTLHNGERYFKQADDSNDCGLFVLRAIECFAYGIDLRKEVNMNNYRRYVDRVLFEEHISCS